MKRFWIFALAVAAILLCGCNEKPRKSDGGSETSAADTVARELKVFGKIRSFADLTTRNIKLWDDSLKAKLNCQSSVHGYHKRLKPYILEAIQLELLNSNPYDGIKIPRDKSEGIKYLTEDERNRIENLELYGPVEKARDMFKFSCYTGLAYSDLIKVSRKDIFMEGDDMCIVDKRQKIGSAYTIVLLPKAIEILESVSFFHCIQA